MSSTLAQLRDRVEQTLADVSNAIWSATWLDEAIRQALAEYNAVMPSKIDDTFTLESLSDNGREFPFTLTGAIDVLQVQIPYSQTDLPAPARAFVWHRDMNNIELTTYTASPTDTARIYYTVPRTIKDLDSATGTTVRAEHETLLVLGAAAMATLSRSLDLVEQITISNQTTQEMRLWAEARLKEFRAALNTASRQAVSGQPWVALPKLDRWDK